MANTISNNFTSRTVGTSRPPYDQTNTHRFCQEFNFQDLTTTAKSVNDYILAQATNNEVKLLPCRTHIEITNTHATATIYVKRFYKGSTTVTSAIYQYKLVPAGGYVKIPCHPDMDLQIISDTASTTGIITELG